MYNGPIIPKNGLKYIWDFSNPKGINNIEGAFGNEIFTKTNLEPSNGAIIHSGSTANDNYLEVDGTNDECPTGIDVSWNNTNNCSWAFWFLADSTQYLGGILGKEDALWEWSIWQQSTTVIRLVYWNSSGGHTNGMDFGVTSAGDTRDIWSFCSYTWEGSSQNAKFYLYNTHGKATNTHTATNSSINQNRSNNFCMGGKIYTWSDKYWGGEIGPVYFYDRKLNDNEVDKIYNATKSRFGL